MSEKILFTDLDGTLLNSAKKVSPGMQLLLSKMVLAGNRLVLTSGRALPSVLKVAKNAGLLFPDTVIIAANGNEVYDCDTGALLGTLTAVDEYPASKVYTVKGDREILIPAVKDAFIRSVDLDAGRMDVKVWEGM